MPCLLYPQGKSTWYPVDRRLGRTQSWSGHGDDEKNSLPLLQIKPWLSSLLPSCYTD